MRVKPPTGGGRDAPSPGLYLNSRTSSTGLSGQSCLSSNPQKWKGGHMRALGCPFQQGPGFRHNSTMREERRLLTVLFADVVGSTELGSETDPEVLRQQMTRYYERMKEVAETHGGMVEKFIGDAVMAVFGVPRLHDDDAERAVRSGLVMQTAMAELNQELGTELRVRVG